MKNIPKTLARGFQTSQTTGNFLELASSVVNRTAAELAAIQGDRDDLAAESADLIYHWLVVLARAGVSLDDVAAKLEAREGTSGLAEKASRTS